MRYSEQAIFRTLPSLEEARRLVRAVAGTVPTREPRRVDKPLILYGAGNMGRLAKSYLDRIGITPEAVVDHNAAALADDPFWQGSALLEPDLVPERLKECALLAVSVCTVPFVPLQDDLLALGWRDVVPFYDVAEAHRQLHPLSNGWFTGALDAAKAEAIGEALAGWSDSSSRAHHLQFLAWHSLRQEWVFEGAPVTAGDRFFIPEVRSVLTGRESLLDLGAHHGEVSLAFVDLVDRRFEKLWLVEPDAINLGQLKGRLATALDPSCREKVELFEVAVGATPGRRGFFPGLDYASQFCNFGPQTVRVETVDALGVSPSFVKLHLEGWELEALEGAKETLRRARPIVAATAYHNIQGLWELPLWLMRRLDGYRFHFRLHSWCGTGAVVYAIPVERGHRQEAL